LGWRETPTKPYQWVHYNEALLRAKNFGSGLVALGLEANPNTFVGIYSQNCPEWVLTEQGAYCYSMVIVPLYDTLGPDACAYIIKQGRFIPHFWPSAKKMKPFWDLFLQQIST
jgi:long-chain acyl-CoA synthetase